MNKPMTPSTETMTGDQINKAVATTRAMFEKHAPEFNKDAVQQALSAKGLAHDLLAVFRKYIELFSNLIMRLVQVDRRRTPEEAIAATGRKQYVNSAVVAAMPKGSGDEAKVIFFKPDASAYDANGWMSDEKLEQEYASRNLKPADPYSLAAVNEGDPAFADEHPNATHWQDADGKWCYAAFCQWDDERHVNVHRYDFPLA